MEKRFKVLRTIGKIYKILGIIAAVFTILTALGICALSVLGTATMSRYAQEWGGTPMPIGVRAWGTISGVIGGLIIIFIGAMITVTFYGLGEGVELLIALEENTRKSADLLNEMGSSTE